MSFRNISKILNFQPVRCVSVCVCVFSGTVKVCRMKFTACFKVLPYH